MTGTLTSNSLIKTTNAVEIASAQPRLLLDRGDGSYSWNIYNGGGTDFPLSSFNIANNANTAIITALDGGNVGIGTTSPADRLHVALDSSTTNAEVEVMRVEATSSGTPAVGFGPFIDFRGDRINGGPDSYARLGFEADAMPSTTVDGAFVVQTAEDEYLFRKIAYNF